MQVSDKLNPGIIHLDKCPCLKSPPPLPARLSSLPRGAGAEIRKFRLVQLSVMGRCQGPLEMAPASPFPVKHVAPSRSAWAGRGVLRGARQALVPGDHNT